MPPCPLINHVEFYYIISCNFRTRKCCRKNLTCIDNILIILYMFQHIFDKNPHIPLSGSLTNTWVTAPAIFPVLNDWWLPDIPCMIPPVVLKQVWICHLHLQTFILLSGMFVGFCDTNFILFCFSFSHSIGYTASPFLISSVAIMPHRLCIPGTGCLYVSRVSQNIPQSVFLSIVPKNIILVIDDDSFYPSWIPLLLLSEYCECWFHIPFRL